MDKLYFKTRKEEIQSKIDSYNKEMKELKNEYISSNQKFPIGSKVCLTIPAHTVRLLWGNETKIIPEEKKFAYVNGLFHQKVFLFSTKSMSIYRKCLLNGVKLLLKN